MDMRQHPSTGAIPIREHCALPTRQPPRDEPLTADSPLNMSQAYGSYEKPNRQSNSWKEAIRFVIDILTV
jgi:hypothetical protein